MIKKKKGDVFANLEPNVAIPHVVNNYGFFDAGFARAVKKSYPGHRGSYIKVCETYTPDELLGKIRTANYPYLTGRVWIIDMFAQRGIRSSTNTHPLSYELLKVCLQKTAAFCEEQNLKVFAPKFGSGLAGGDWNKIERLIEEYFTNLDVTIFEYD